MITVIEGRMGSGKTLVLAKLAKAEIDRGEREVYARAPFTFSGWKDFDLEKFSDQLVGGNLEGVEVCSIYLDEAYALLDARSTNTKVNRLMAYLATREGVDLYLTTVHMDMIDKRVRQNVNLRIQCTYEVEEKKLNLSAVNLKSGSRSSSSLDAVDLFPLITSLKATIRGDSSSEFVASVLGLEEGGE